MKYRRIKFCDDIERFYPIKDLNDDTAIVGFSYIGDMQLTNYAAYKLMPLIDENRVDVIITAEIKGIPLAQELARILGVNYICLRKQEKVYMDTQYKFSGSSITSGNNLYYISKKECDMLEGKTAIFIDDVYSTGSTLEVVRDICFMKNCKLLAAYFILKEYKTKDRPVRKFGKYYMWQHKKISCAAIQAIPLIKRDK